MTSGTIFYPLDAAIAARRDLPPSAKLLLAIIRFRIGNNGHSWSGTRRMARDCGVDRKTVMDALSRLEAAGLLLVQRRGCGQLNHYSLPPICGGESGPVEELDQWQDSTDGGDKSPPGVVENLHPKRTEKNKEKNKRSAAPPDARIKAFIDWFSQRYRAALGRPYIVISGKDGAIIKQLLQSQSVNELQQAAGNMLADGWGKEHASVGLLANQINTWRGGKPNACKGGTFTPATTNGTGYDSLVKRF